MAIQPLGPIFWGTEQGKRARRSLGYPRLCTITNAQKNHRQHLTFVPGKARSGLSEIFRCMGSNQSHVYKAGTLCPAVCTDQLWPSQRSVLKSHTQEGMGWRSWGPKSTLNPVLQLPLSTEFPGGQGDR